jgi:hypothetical protein
MLEAIPILTEAYRFGDNLSVKQTFKEKQSVNQAIK